MCDICLQTPCASGCPNATPEKVMFTCEMCGEDIVKGETYYEFWEVQVCESCVASAREEA